MPKRKKAIPRRAPRIGWGERKERYNLNLTPTVVKWLDEQANKQEISRSEYLERVVRGLMEGVWDFGDEDLVALKKHLA